MRSCITDIRQGEYWWRKYWGDDMSGFWNIHVCYSNQVHIDGSRIMRCGAHGPSTDGISRAFQIEGLGMRRMMCMITGRVKVRVY